MTNIQKNSALYSQIFFIFNIIKNFLKQIIQLLILVLIPSAKYESYLGALVQLHTRII